MAIHPTAIIDSAAELGPSVEIGPYAVIDGPVKIHAETRIYPHTYLTGCTEIGPGCQIHPFASIGHLPQDLNFEGHQSCCRIGAGTVIREYCSVHRGTQPNSVTVIGENCYLMAGSHVAHNSVLGDRVTLVNGVASAGHVEIGSGAVISALACIHQFVRIGQYVMLSGGGLASMDVPPFMTMQSRNLVTGINRVGLRRAKFSAAEIDELHQAYKTLYRSGLPGPRAIARLAAEVQTDAGRSLLEFLQAPSKRGVAIGPRHAHRRSGGAASS
ncbi:MAG: acyl-ACP--UDP-N-acetylglucosamine O-acyltransferase [bacterium]|nr:acyl-ACP--UDP-N-acetylglucosamine O-acyltransferase [bacterium]